jgi:hypothetical protein
MRLVLGLVLACLAGSVFANTAAPRATLRPFADEREFGELIERWRAQARRRQESRRADAVGGSLAMQSAPAAPAAAAKAEGSAAESITNVQTAGVDEGGIVKRAGDHLVILRRGRLFTVKVGGDALQPVAMLDAYAPGSNPQGAWYDELLIHGNTVVVIGYSYARGGTEVGLFELGRDGSLAYRATHHLRSFDYYSSRNYASRLVGSKLVFYTPLQLHPWALPQPEHFMPQWRRWHPAVTPAEWQRILPATRIYRTDDEIDPFSGGAALHTVTACDLARPEDLRCESSAVLGPPGRVFYVSAGNVYVWTVEGLGRASPMQRSAVFRLPLDGAAPSALKTTGAPIDQLSFLEDESGHLNVLLRAQGRGEGMWAAERGAGSFALLRVALSSFGDGRGSAPRNAYRPLPGGAGHQVHNRFVGDWLLYGQLGTREARALRYADREGDAQALALAHGVERIEALGRDALLVGNAGSDLHFTSLRLARQAEIASTHVQPDAQQGETRTHGFFYRATGRAGSGEGLLGLPITGRGAGRVGFPGGGGESAAVVFLRQSNLALREVGRLDAREQAGTRHDACKASCVDWYGNARPIFLGDRVLALLGYELVEARMARGWAGAERIEELRRVTFAPPPSLAWGR